VVLSACLHLAKHYSACAVYKQDGEVRAFPEPFAQQPYLLHLGLQCYARQFLQEYCRMAPTPLMVRAVAWRL